MITFERARAVAAASRKVRRFFGEGYSIRPYGWQNDEVFMVVALAADGVEMFDAPDVLVDKQTGALTLVYGLLGKMPADNLVPIGDVPE